MSIETVESGDISTIERQNMKYGTLVWIRNSKDKSVAYYTSLEEAKREHRLQNPPEAKTDV